jgi:predicted metal-dependent hydrolase
LGSIQIDGRQINYHIRAGKSVKYTYLKFTPDLELDVVLPHESDIDVEALLKKKRAWIARKYAELSNRKCVFDGVSVMYKGRYYHLRVVPPENSLNVEVRKDKIVISARDLGDPLSSLKEWMTAATTELLTRDLPRHANRFKITLGAVVVRNIKRWGYCSKTGALVFTWQLIALPDRLAEYVMLHELAHLSEFNHSRKFWTKLASMCPDFRERQQAVNQFCTSKSADLKASEVISSTERFK